MYWSTCVLALEETTHQGLEEAGGVVSPEDACS